MWLVQIPYSGKFLRSNTSSRKFVTAKFLSPKISCRVTGSAAQHDCVRLPQLAVSKKLTYVVIEASSKLQKFFARPMINSPVVTATANRSSELAPFGLTVSRRQQPTRFDKRGNVLLSFDVEIHTENHHFQIVGGVARYHPLGSVEILSSQ